jgi:hypothetical protein
VGYPSQWLPTPDPLSIKLRIFGPYESDLIVIWDEARHVESIKRPIDLE